MRRSPDSVRGIAASQTADSPGVTPKAQPRLNPRCAILNPGVCERLVPLRLRGEGSDNRLVV
jgi:hypothetical protein